MQGLFRKAFGIYQGEGAHSLRFVRLALLWAFGSCCMETLSDGLFLTHIGSASLPSIYLSIALGMIGMSSLVLYSLRITSPYRIFTVAMAAGISLAIFASFMVASSPPDWF